MKQSIATARAAVLLAALAMPGVACAGAEVDRQVEQLRAEFEHKLKALQQTYETRLQEMEARLARSENQAKPATAVVASAARAPATPVAPSAFNPEISLVLQGALVKQQEIEERHLTGFLPAGHAHGGERGLSLGHTELLLSANIDANFRGHANFAIVDDAVEVEEAWFQSLGLGNGLTLKGGRFLSGIGYANEQHPHAWDFSDQSLMYRALFGAHLVQDGVQLKWLAPTETWLEFGLEAGRGQNFPGSAVGGNRNGPGAWAAFARIGDDVGVAHSWRAGVNYLTARPREREAHLDDVAGVEALTTFSGKSKTWLADFVWKWSPEGNARSQSFKFQTEIFRRDESGAMACADNSADGGVCTGLADAYRARQSGWYAQGVYQFLPGWRAGYRYDRLNPGRVSFNTLPFANADYKPVRHSLMADYSPSEFSRFRLQLARDRSMQGITDNQATLQYIHSLGAHGAHKF